MLPILRVIPVGGVLLAIAILILALNPPGDPRLRDAMTSTGALMARDQHPEWPQLLMLAAVRRADELRRLRELPDTPVRSAPPEVPLPAEKPPEVAAVPGNRTDTDPEDVTGTVVQTPGASLPLDIGETSSTELPVIPQEERPPVIMMPQRTNSAHESTVVPEPAKPVHVNSVAPAQQPSPPARKRVRRVHRARPAPAKQASAQLNFFDVLFGNPGTGQPSAATNTRPFSAQ
jgi:hypothetical protein